MVSWKLVLINKNSVKILMDTTLCCIHIVDFSLHLRSKFYLYFIRCLDINFLLILKVYE